MWACVPGRTCVLTELFWADYVLVLEAEILNLKDKFKTLEAQLDVSGPLKRSSSHTDIQPRFPPTMESAGKSPRPTVSWPPSQ